MVVILSFILDECGFRYKLVDSLTSFDVKICVIAHVSVQVHKKSEVLLLYMIVYFE